MGAAFKNMIPWQPWELLTSEQLVETAKWLGARFYIPLTLSAMYIVFCFGGQEVLKSHKGWDKPLRMPLAYWSVFLAVFSIMGSLRTVPALTDMLMKRGVEHVVCGDTRHEWLIEHPAGFWTFLFCMSKVPELFDTVFIVLRKKELIMLHWYHHFTVMLFCWQAWSSCSVNGIIYAAMNLTVHSVMYAFYALTAIGYRPTSYAIFITLGQIFQMVVGTAVTGYVTLDKVLWHPVEQWEFSLGIPDFFFAKEPIPDGGECHVTGGSALSGLIMYGSYLVLFVAFFYSAYCRKGAKGE